jgi:small-conductance mechanosensitive channel
MAVIPTMDESDEALKRLEAALDAIDRGLRARPASVTVAADADLQQVEERLDAAIDFVKSALGRKIDS